ncbi:unnamed protein product [Didymodactylos carnosus]|uniref:Uncharacterized protein n=1 Tax=Didymodactylos carnosus TaxID=1234261 RepID=A0A813SKF9_9BILA|nr:unnamed protein product [Didymodactylos carnosus]CAF3582001.1 unnamed protein product [Didymodactylos carnosus]
MMTRNHTISFDVSNSRMPHSTMRLTKSRIRSLQTLSIEVSQNYKYDDFTDHHSLDKLRSGEPCTSSDNFSIDCVVEQNRNKNMRDVKDGKHEIKSFIDPVLIIQKQKHVAETWLNEFQAPMSAPQSAYSPLAQLVKKALPERTACRLGGRGNHHSGFSYDPTSFMEVGSKLPQFLTY